MGNIIIKFMSLVLNIWVSNLKENKRLEYIGLDQRALKPFILKTLLSTILKIVI
jgi:hypothetical protein